MLFATAKSYPFFSLFSLIFSLEKSRVRFREKWRVKREEWRVQKEKAAYATFLFGCGGGIFHCPPPSHSRLPSPRRFAYTRLGILLALGGFASAKTTLSCFCLATHDLLRRSWSTDSASRAKKQRTPNWCPCFFGCGGGIWTSRPPGYEPDELPSCSTPRYWFVSVTVWCRWPGSNRYDTLVSRDFKSRASAYSATPANSLPRIIPSVSIVYYNTSCFSCQAFFCFSLNFFIFAFISILYRCAVLSLCGGEVKYSKIKWIFYLFLPFCA